MTALPIDPRIPADTETDSTDPYLRLARESGRTLGELGVRPEDGGWIRAHAEAIGSLARVSRAGPRPGGIRETLYRLARRAARTAR